REAADPRRRELPEAGLRSRARRAPPERAGRRPRRVLPRRGPAGRRRGLGRAVIARVVSWCARHPGLVIAVALLAAAGGELARRRLAGDVIPELADPQIGLVADWMGHPAPEVATAVTGVLTGALADVPGATAVRGWTMSGMAYVDVVFAGGGDLDAARGA